MLEHPAARNAAATSDAIGTPSISINALVAPMRRLAPPVSTAPTNNGANNGANRGGTSSGVSVSGNPCGIELEQEDVAPFGLVGLADPGGDVAEPAQRTQEALIRRLGPSDVTAPPPSIGPQRVEAPVVADAIGGVALHVVAPQIAEFGPTVERPRSRRHDLGHGGPSLFGRLSDGLGEALRQYGIGSGDDGGRETRREIDRLVAHSLDRTAWWQHRRTVAQVLALTLDDAKTIAIVVATVLAVGAVVSFWIMKSIVQKLAVAALLGVSAFAVWTQRVSLQDCADKVQNNFERAGADVSVTDTECSFFGITITVSDPRSPGSSNGG